MYVQSHILHLHHLIHQASHFQQKNYYTESKNFHEFHRHLEFVLPKMKDKGPFKYYVIKGLGWWGRPGVYISTKIQNYSGINCKILEIFLEASWKSKSLFAGFICLEHEGGKI